MLAWSPMLTVNGNRQDSGDPLDFSSVGSEELSTRARARGELGFVHSRRYAMLAWK